MYKIVTCHLCGVRFDILLTKGNPYAAVCGGCASKLNRMIRAREERKS